MRAGVIGTGWVACDRHIPAYRRNRRSSVEAVFDRSPERAEAVRKRFKIGNAYSELEPFLASSIEAVSICTPPFAHAELIEASLNAGKHVLVEKPFTLTSEEGRRVEALAAENDLVLVPAHNFLYARSALRARQMVDSGETGEVISAVGLQMSSWRRRLPDWYDRLPGGLFFDEAPHLLYLMRSFIGEMEVRSAHRQQRDGRIERTQAALSGERGDGELSMWTGAPFSEWYVMVVCAKSVLLIDLFRDILIDLPAEKAHNRRDVVGLGLRGTLQHWAGTLTSGARVLAGRGSYGHDRLISSFVSAVEDGAAPPAAAADGVRIVELMEAILAKAESSGG